MLPTFIVIGAGKAGTTSLWAYLREHPQVFMSARKELDFFTTEHNWHRGLGWYESHFADAGDATAIGEVSGNYTNWPDYLGVPERMASAVPDARLIYVIRHPVDRMVSGYRYLRARGLEDRPMEQAFRERAMYTNASSYASQIDQFLRHFAREQLLVIVSERLRDDRATTMDDVFAFLGVDPAQAGTTFARELNRTAPQMHRPRAALRLLARSPGYRRLAATAPPGLKRMVQRVGKTAVMSEAEQELTDALRRELEDKLHDETARLRTHLGDDFDCWGLA